MMRSVPSISEPIEVQIRFARARSMPTTVLYFKLTMKKNLSREPCYSIRKVTEAICKNV